MAEAYSSIGIDLYVASIFFYTIMPCIASMCTPVCVLSTNVIVFRSVTVTEKVITVKSINITAVISF